MMSATGRLAGLGSADDKIESGGLERIATWMLDTDNDGRSLYPSKVLFPMAGEKDGLSRPAENLMAEIDEELIEANRGTISLPFAPGKYKRSAARIIDDRGTESLEDSGDQRMKICKIKLQEFSAFEHIDIEFSPGLNVFIGANATGKSHLMKLMYSILRVVEAKPKRQSHVEKPLRLKEKLAAIFMPDKGEVGRLVRRARGRKKAQINLGVTDWASHVELTTLGNLTFEWLGPPPPKRSIFIPSRETLSMFDGFIAAYDDQKLSFDETYYDLCVALSGKPLRGRRVGTITSLLEPLTELLGGAVVLEGGRFHVHAKDGLIEAHLLAEGFRKIAGIAHLIGNGSLMKNGFLFWDEPEANLNPRLITRIASALRTLAHGGVQVFIATHDYLLSHELSLAVEYQTKPKTPTRFFTFNRTDSGPVSIQAGNTLAELEHNPILDEFAAHYDRERELFSQRGGAGRKKTSRRKSGWRTSRSDSAKAGSH